MDTCNLGVQRTLTKFLGQVISCKYYTDLNRYDLSQYLLLALLNMKLNGLALIILTWRNRSASSFVFECTKFADVIEMESWRTPVYVGEAVDALVKPPAGCRIGVVAIAYSLRTRELLLLVIFTLVATSTVVVVLAVNCQWIFNWNESKLRSNLLEILGIFLLVR